MRGADALGHGSFLQPAPYPFFRALLSTPPFVLAALMAGCASQGPASLPAAPDLPPPPVVLGADRDAHGCIPTAGYAWCERLLRCERPWELAAERGLPNTPDSFASVCGGTAPGSVTPIGPAPDPDADGLAGTAPAPAAAPLPGSATPLPPVASPPPEATAPAQTAPPAPADAQR